MTNEKEEPDAPLTPQQEAIANSLSEEFVQTIDKTLLSHANVYWRKVAMLVALTMAESETRIAGLPDVFYSKRIRKLVEAGVLESAGDLDYMRFSEVRLSAGVACET